MTPQQYAVRLTESAEEDLQAISRYVRLPESAEVARRLLLRMLEKIDALEQFPNRGSIPPELESLGLTDFRQTLLVPYRIFYAVAETEVIIHLIADGRRDMGLLLESRLLG